MTEYFDKRIEALEEKLEKIKDQKRKAAKKRADMENEKKRRIETRKKVLIGATLLARAERDASVGQWLGKLLAAELKREGDRRLFNLDAKPEQKSDAQ